MKDIKRDYRTGNESRRKISVAVKGTTIDITKIK
jgi:hypothetical protein